MLILTPGCAQTQATSSQSSNPVDKPKRPLNAFFLYRSHLHKHRLINERHQSSFSVTAAQMWKSLSHAEKQRWYREAKRVKAEHLEKYPGLSLRWSPERKARAKAEREERARKRWSEALLRMKREEVEVAIFPHPMIAGDPTDVLSECGLSTAVSISCVHEHRREAYLNTFSHAAAHRGVAQNQQPWSPPCTNATAKYSLARWTVISHVRWTAVHRPSSTSSTSVAHRKMN